MWCELKCEIMSSPGLMQGYSPRPYLLSNDTSTPMVSSDKQNAHYHIVVEEVRQLVTRKQRVFVCTHPIEPLSRSLAWLSYPPSLFF